MSRGTDNHFTRFETRLSRMKTRDPCSGRTVVKCYSPVRHRATGVHHQLRHICNLRLVVLGMDGASVWV